MVNKQFIWKPLPIEDIQQLFKTLSIPWWIAGGWALDLYVGAKTRDHDDIDVVIVRDDVHKLNAALTERWELYKAVKGELTLWERNEVLPSYFDNLWVKRIGSDTWNFQVMIVDTHGGDWLYKRKKTITRPIEEIGLQTAEGVPYLRPEIQLLYKGGSSHIREKDVFDLETLLPIMSKREINWLKDSLNDQFPEGHDWIDRLKT
ncbi:nucleotidyltransferase domain-containing protein [Alteribacter aurantiacus]|uniref:nucleotidyltransferase domain-containing protein n=1 Tax=Alteribacter aurantiacus TaxID=254410 RepID=UPI0004006186|nr:hypothetical protein [Alteribacter aurantiacus]